MGEGSTHLPSSPSPVAVSPTETQLSDSPFVPTSPIIDQQLVNGSDSESELQTMSSEDGATNSGMLRNVYQAAERGDISKLRWMNNWKHQKTPTGNNVLHIHVGKPLEIHKDVITENISISFVEYVLNETTENSFLSQANCEGDTPLHFAARFGQTQAVLAFLDRADMDIEGLLNKVNSSSDTALHDAARGGHANIVKLLVEAGGENDLQHMPNNLRETPLFLAAERGWNELFRIIVSHSSSLALGHKGPCGQTPLHAAILHGNKNIVDQIIRLAPDSSSLIRIKNDQGQTPLHSCASRNVKKQHIILDTLLRHDNENNSAAYIKDDEGRTPLLIAALNFNLRGERKLIYHRPDCIEMVDNKRQNVVHYAANTGKLAALRFILAKALKCDKLINQKDNDGNTPLHLLASTQTPYALFDWRFVLSKFIKRHDKLDVMAFNNNNFTAGDVIASNGTFRHLGPQRLPYKILPRGRRINCGDENIEGTEAEDTISNADVDKGSRKKKEMISDIKRIGETRLVAAALIATVSFTAGFTLPGGFNQSPGEKLGMAVLMNKAAFVIFTLSDAIAFTLSSLAVMCYFQIAYHKDVNKLRRLSVHAQLLNAISLGAMMMSFVTGVYAVVSPFLGLAVILISVIFFYFCLQILALNWQYIKNSYTAYVSMPTTK